MKKKFLIQSQSQIMKNINYLDLLWIFVELLIYGICFLILNVNEK